ncbi:small subunit of acetolactate synthase-domain-containing protein [Globomyces pollinis-pini]|nr:small subunit of acetolactate synthase-domain-containing protein [Globomyces pollinis-pini]
MSSLIYKRLFSSSLNSLQVRRRRPRLPFIATNITPTSAKEAVDNILYNAPPINNAPLNRHTLNCLVANEPGVLSRVSGILAGRGINIESLVVARTEVNDLSRMTIVINGQDEKIDQARKQLEDIVPVWAVLDYSAIACVVREMLLIKVATVPHEFESDDSILQDVEHQADGLSSLVSSSLQRQTITELARLFQARVVDVSMESVVIELAAKPSRIDAFVELLKPYGILEAARSGAMAMPRSHIDGLTDNTAVIEDSEGVDATMLPPG